MSISILTKSFFFALDKLVNFKVWGIIHTWNPFFVFLETVKDIPLILIDAFSIKFFLSLDLILKSNKKDLSILLIEEILPVQSTCPCVVCPDICFPNYKGNSKLI